MSKYAEIIKINFKAQIVWRFDVAINALFIVGKIFFAFILWGAIFGENETISGFSFNSMVSYYIISSFLSQLDLSSGVGSEIGDRIKGGTFSKYMVIPVNTQAYFIAQTFGAMLFYLIFDFITAVIWMIIFGIPLTLATDPLIIAEAFVMTALGLLFMIQLNYFIGMLAFKYQDISAFIMIKNNIISFITGGLIPLALLPGGVTAVMRIFPFYYVCYLPSMLLIGKNTGEAVSGIIILAVWLVMFTAMNFAFYEIMRKKYDGAGI